MEIMEIEDVKERAASKKIYEDRLEKSICNNTFD